MKFVDTSLDQILTGQEPQHIPKPLFHVALVEPEIPQNTGNIGRTCVGTRADLHLVGKLGFDITDRNLKRAGLDYWQHLRWKRHETISGWQQEIKNPKRVFYFSAKATKYHHEIQYQEGDWLVFGKETKGLPDEILEQCADQCALIPILGPVRGYNVATAVAIVLFEALRQLDVQGKMPRDFILDPDLLADDRGDV